MFDCCNGVGSRSVFNRASLLLLLFLHGNVGSSIFRDIVGCVILLAEVAMNDDNDGADGDDETGSDAADAASATGGGRRSGDVVVSGGGRAGVDGGASVALENSISVHGDGGSCEGGSSGGSGRSEGGLIEGGHDSSFGRAVGRGEDNSDGRAGLGEGDESDGVSVDAGDAGDVVDDGRADFGFTLSFGETRRSLDASCEIEVVNLDPPGADRSPSVSGTFGKAVVAFVAGRRRNTTVLAVTVDEDLQLTGH